MVESIISLPSAFSVSISRQKTFRFILHLLGCKFSKYFGNRQIYLEIIYVAYYTHKGIITVDSGMKYFSWLWNNSRGIRWNTVVRIIAGIIQVVLSLLMVWLSKRFIDETIRTGTAGDVLRMVELLVLTVVGGVILRQVGYWLRTSANVRQSNALRLRIFGSLFHDLPLHR